MMKFVITGWILVAVGMLIWLYFWRKQEKQDDIIFFSAHIQGQLTYVSGSSGGESLQLKDSTIVYSFVSNLSFVNDYDNFARLAERGDSVFKPAFADTIKLIKKSGRIYRFTFKKPNE